MKILQISNRVPFPLSDGGAIAIYNAAKYLREQGHQVFLAALNTSKHFCEASTLDAYNQIYTVSINTDLRWDKALNNLLFSSIPYNVQRFLSEEFSLLLLKIIQENPPDIIQLEGIHTALYYDVLRNASHAPIILRAHNVEYEIWNRYTSNEKNLFRRLYLRHLTKRLQRFEASKALEMDAILTLTEKDEQYFRGIGFKKPMMSIPVGVSEKWLHQPEPAEISELKHIAYLGSLEWLPNVQGIEWFLKNVWKPWQATHPEVQFHIAGRNPSPQLKSWEHAFAGVVFHGEVPDALDFLQNYPVVIVPLLSGSGMRVKIIESMALGKCVLTSSIGAEGIPLINHEHAFITNQPSEWIQTLNYLYENPNEVKQVAKNAKAWIKLNYQWKHLVHQMANFYESLLTPHHANA